MGNTGGASEGLPRHWVLPKGLPAKLGHFGAITSLHLMKSLWLHPSVASVWKSTWKAALGAEARDSLWLGPGLVLTEFT